MATKDIQSRLVTRLGVPSMHELSVTQQILDIALAQAEAAAGTRITRINLVIGDMSSIIDDCVQFYFDFLSQDSIAGGATLSFKRIPLQVRCRHCQLSFTPDGASWSCPQCRQWDVEIVAGNEFYLESIEVE